MSRLRLLLSSSGSTSSTTPFASSRSVECRIRPSPSQNAMCVVRSLLAVRDEVSAAQVVLANRRAGLLLLVGVARHEAAEAAVRHVDEAGAVDAALGHPAPEVRRAEVGARLLDRVAVGRALGEPRPRDCPSDGRQRRERIQPG